MSKSKIIYSWPSLIDGKPIVCIVLFNSKNAKTGANMAQTYIIRSDISPLEASKSGLDYSICGDCKHRGNATDNPTKRQAEKRSCYVNLGQRPTIVFKALQRGAYGVASPDEIKTMAKGLYSIALNCVRCYLKARESAARHMLERLKDEGLTHTPDGAPYSVSSIRAAMVGM